MKMIKAFDAGTRFPYKTNNDIKKIKRSYEIAETVVTRPNSNRPLTSISWYDAIKLCNNMTCNEMSNKDCVYKIKGNKVKKNNDQLGYRLPTNHEWLAAARFITEDKAHENNSIKIDGKNWLLDNHVSGCPYPSSNIEESAKYAVFNQDKITKVKTKLPNGLGIYDMSGLVWEWCFNKSSSNRSKRGGSWYNSSNYCELDYQNYNYSNTNYNIGFRPVRTIFLDADLE